MDSNNRLRNWAHPNRLTAYGAGFCAAGLGLVMGGESTDVFGLGFILMGNVMDYADGRVARSFDMRTVEGARVDSLTDKFKNLMVGGYIVGSEFVRGNVVLPLTMGANFVVDTISQKQRGDLYKQAEEVYRAVRDPDSCEEDREVESTVRANYWGKTKAVIQMGVGLGYVGKEVFQNHFGAFSEQSNENISLGLSALLLISAVSGGVGIWKRVRGK